MRRGWQRLRRDRLAILCSAVILFFVLIAVLAGPLTSLTGTDPYKTNMEQLTPTGIPLVGNSLQHPFGVEPKLGRDLFARWAYGAQVSLGIAGIATIVTTVLGVTLGLIAGFFGGLVDRVVGWLIDFFLSLPLLMVAIAISPIILTYFQGAGEETRSLVQMGALVVILTMFGWTGLARLIRGEVLSLREREFVQAARIVGMPTRRVLFRELLPNLMGPVIVSVSIALPTFVAGEATLSYLGVGVLEPTPSWGRTIQDAVNYYNIHPWYLYVPVVSTALLVLALNLLGDSIRDAFDPKTTDPRLRAAAPSEPAEETTA